MGMTAAIPQVPVPTASICYHDVSDEHLQQYIDEAVYRWNTRKMSESERFAHMFDKSIGLVRKWSEIRVGLMAA